MKSKLTFDFSGVCLFSGAIGSRVFLLGSKENWKVLLLNTRLLIPVKMQGILSLTTGTTLSCYQSLGESQAWGQWGR